MGHYTRNGTKARLFEDYLNYITSDVVKDVMDRLFNLYRDDRITYGCYWVNNYHEHIHYEKLSDLLHGKTPLRKARMWDINYSINAIKESILKAKKLVEEQENVPFEQTQKQVLHQKLESELKL